MIILHDYAQPLRKRLESRRYCGPYRWQPSRPMTGRGFYCGPVETVMARHGAGLDLRLMLANSVLPSYSRLARINGYFCDEYGDGTLIPIVARLPRGRGFLAGWTMGANMCATLDSQIHETARDAAIAAHDLAERDAEQERERQALGCMEEQE